MFNFQNLDVYKKSRLFHLACKTILKEHKAEKYVIDQMGRASFSIVLNIAEGLAKTSNADRRNYFTVARGSVFECVAVLDLLNDEHRLSDEQYQTNLGLADEISRMLYIMIQNLSK
ncbi:MAG: four helix bundle protein [Chitinophagaceae bacterium]